MHLSTVFIFEILKHNCNYVWETIQKDNLSCTINCLHPVARMFVTFFKMVVCSHVAVLALVAVCSSYVLYQYFHSLQNSGANSVGNKMPRQFQNFSVCFSNTLAKKLPKTQHKSLYITSAMASAYLSILPCTMAWFFNS